MDFHKTVYNMTILAKRSIVSPTRWRLCSCVVETDTTTHPDTTRGLIYPHNMTGLDRDDTSLWAKHIIGWLRFQNNSSTGQQSFKKEHNIWCLAKTNLPPLPKHAFSERDKNDP